MHLPLEIRFRDVPHSKRLEEHIREKADHLARFFDSIQRCAVVVEAPHRKQRVGQRFHVRMNLVVPGEDLVVSHDAGRDEEHDDAGIAVNQAFRAMQRRLQDYVKRRRHAEKLHEQHPLGRIIRIVPEEDFGFIEAYDGRQVYFHRNSVIGDRFDELSVDMPVRFAEELGQKGPQACSVHLA
jgi:cold shock CspA family protein/ribosome-associated translation inhibitor RaiA